MKRTVGMIKLNRLDKAELEQRALNALRGGCKCEYFCGCVCVEIGDYDCSDESFG